MRTLEAFQTQLLRILQSLGETPSLADVDAAGRELVEGGMPDGASLEGLLLLGDLARLRSVGPREG